MKIFSIFFIFLCLPVYIFGCTTSQDLPINWSDLITVISNIAMATFAGIMVYQIYQTEKWNKINTLVNTFSNDKLVNETTLFYDATQNTFQGPIPNDISHSDFIKLIEEQPKFQIAVQRYLAFFNTIASYVVRSQHIEEF